MSRRCYHWEDKHIHARDQSVVPFDQAQSIVDYVWSKAGLTYPPKIRPISKNAKKTRANATRLQIRIPKSGIKTTVLLHEIAHSMTSDALGASDRHGPRFVGVFMRLLCEHIPTFQLTQLMYTAKLESLDFNLDGPIHHAS
jgi:hypothetical protein